MPRASLVAILALVLGGAGSVACTNAPEDFGGGGSSGSGNVGSRRREPRGATGGIDGNPETPDEEELTGANAGSGEEDEPPPPPSGEAPAPLPDPDPGPEPDPDPAPAPDPIPPGSFAVGTELATTANLNIREGAGTTYAIVTTAPSGSRVTVVSVSGASGWVNISWNGSVGWSSKAYLTVP